MRSVIRHLRRAALLQAGEGPADGQLLESFLSRRDEAAFEALLRRHGPMVLGVCRRVLGNEADAEDAFQATFLVLVRKAAAVRPREAVGNWLYGVACRTAMKARAMSAKRRAKEKQARGRLPQELPRDDVPEELLAQLDVELSRLPDKYRAAVVLCDLEGKSRKEAAGQLKIPEGTLSSRLAQARKLLARRLSLHETALSGGALAVLLCRGAASGSVPPPLLASTAKAGVALAAGGVLAAGAVPAPVVALTEGVVKAMLLSKLKLFSAVGIVLAVAVSAGAGLTYRAAAQGPVQGRFVATEGAARPAGAFRPDDLEAIRLEMEALRKEVRALRERVRTLEAQATAQASGSAGQVKLRTLITERDAARDLADEYERQLRAGNVLDQKVKLDLQTQAAQQRSIRDARNQEIEDLKRIREAARADRLKYHYQLSLSAAEAALQKLRANPDDKQAAAALEQALLQLQERQGAARPTESKKP